MIFVDGEVIKIKGKKEVVLTEGCAIIGTILTMVEVRYEKEERERFFKDSYGSGT